MLLGIKALTVSLMLMLLVGQVKYRESKENDIYYHTNGNDILSEIRA